MNLEETLGFITANVSKFHGGTVLNDESGEQGEILEIDLDDDGIFIDATSDQELTLQENRGFDSAEITEEGNLKLVTPYGKFTLIPRQA